MPQMPSRELLQQFSAIVGSQYAIEVGDDAMAPFLIEWRDKYQGKAALVLRPSCVQEVSDIMKLAYATDTVIVPQGGNTGVVGGQIPFDSGTEIILSLTRLNQVRKVDPASNTITVDAGVTLEQVQKQAAQVDRLFPLSLASQGSCQIGGNLATNAGGVNVLAYGNMRELTLGLEVVLADGRIWDGLRSLRKDNTGYDMKDLFIGSEGTLGLITGAVLKLFPAVKEKATAFVGLESLEQVAKLFTLATGAGGGKLTAFEILPRIGLEFTLKHGDKTRHPLEQPSEWYALVEISSPQQGEMAMNALEQILGQAFEEGLLEDGAIAATPQQATEFWRLRELMSAMQKPEGGSIKHDISVPIADIPAFITQANKAVTQLIPGCRPVPFGHFGDGNIHYNISQPVDMDKAVYLERWDDMAAVVHGIVADFNGSISAEHGIGRMKKALMAQTKSPVELSLMQSVKRTLDPKGILNPGKVL